MKEHRNLFEFWFRGGGGCMGGSLMLTHTLKALPKKSLDGASRCDVLPESSKWRI